MLRYGGVLEGVHHHQCAVWQPQKGEEDHHDSQHLGHLVSGEMEKRRRQVKLKLQQSLPTWRNCRQDAIFHLERASQGSLVSSESSELPHQFEADFIFGLPLQQKSSDSRAKRDAGFPLASRKAS